MMGKQRGVTVAQRIKDALTSNSLAGLADTLDPKPPVATRGPLDKEAYGYLFRFREDPKRGQFYELNFASGERLELLPTGIKDRWQVTFYRSHGQEEYRRFYNEPDVDELCKRTICGAFAVTDGPGFGISRWSM